MRNPGTNSAVTEPFWPPFLFAMLLGHMAGAFTFCIGTMVVGTLSDIWAYGLAAVTPGSWSRLFEGIIAFPFVTLLLGLWAALMMVPFTLIASPIAWAAARWLGTGLPATMALGALTGLLPAIVIFRDGLPVRTHALHACCGYGRRLRRRDLAAVHKGAATLLSGCKPLADVSVMATPVAA